MEQQQSISPQHPAMRGHRDALVMAVFGAVAGVGAMMALRYLLTVDSALLLDVSTAILGPIGGAVGWWLLQQTWSAEGGRECHAEPGAGRLLRVPLAALAGAVFGPVFVRLGDFVSGLMAGQITWTCPFAGSATMMAVAGGVTAAMFCEGLTIWLQLRQSLAEIVRQSQSTDKPEQGNE